MTKITKELVLRILKEVQDPSQSNDIVSLGFINNITIKDTNIAVTLEVPVHRGASMEPVRKLAQQKLLKIDGVTPHIYGKKETRPFRKMGHVTIVNKDINEARKVAQKVKETIKVISK